MQTILQRINRHLQETGMPETLFGRRAAGDPRLVGDLRNGRQPRPPLVARIEAYIDAQEQRH